MGNGRRGSHARRPVPSGRQSRHEGRGPALRRLVRRPAAAAMLCCGLLAVGGGTGGILLLTGHGVISPRPVAHPGPVLAGVPRVETGFAQPLQQVTRQDGVAAPDGHDPVIGGQVGRPRLETVQGKGVERARA